MTIHASAAEGALVSNALVDICHACAAHVEESFPAVQSASQRFQSVDDSIFVGGQIDDSATTLSEIQVLSAGNFHCKCVLAFGV